MTTGSARDRLIQPELWQGRRVLVTGHTGFIGGWLAFLLARLGAAVTGYSLPAPTRPSFCAAVGLESLVDSRMGDVLDLRHLRDVVRETRPEVAIHLAAQPIVREAHAAPAETFAVNLMGTVNLLDALRGQPELQAVVLFTTDKVYRNNEWPWGYRETDALGGDEPYAASKASAELAIEAYRHSFFGAAGSPARIATVRAGNVIGGGDWAKDRLVPDAMRAFAAGRVLSVRNPASMRPWQHVIEPVRGTLMLAEALMAAEAGADTAWNFGPVGEPGLPVSRLADRLVALWGAGAEWRAPDIGRQPHEARLLQVDASKAVADLRWRPSLTLERTLEMTVAWYRAHGAGDDMARLTAAQLLEAAPELEPSLRQEIGNGPRQKAG